MVCLEAFDAGLLGVTLAALGEAGPLVRADEFAMRRLRLPARMKGGAMRLRTDVAVAAFVGACCAVLPTMLDRRAAGIVLPCFAPNLAATLGAGSFDDGNVRRRQRVAAI
jgi:hypothetical protein